MPQSDGASVPLPPRALASGGEGSGVGDSFDFAFTNTARDYWMPAFAGKATERLNMMTLVLRLPH
jgi:hypothetical protein